MNTVFLILGILGLFVSGGLIWWYYRMKTKETEQIIHHSEHYFDEELIEPDSDKKTEPLLEPPLLDEPIEKSEESGESDTAQVAEPEPVKKKELFIVLYVVAQQPSGFSGTDVFSVLKEQGLNYGKMKIFHHHGIGELKVKDSIFSVANMVEPGTFDPRKMEEFTTSGLVLFMRLPGPFGGRVAFELMLNTAQRIAEILEGAVKDERLLDITTESIDNVRDRISAFEKS